MNLEKNVDLILPVYGTVQCRTDDNHKESAVCQ